MHRSPDPASRPASWTLATVLALVVGAVVLLAGPSQAHAQALKGKVVVSDAEFGTGFGSDAEMTKAVKKQSKTTIKGEGGTWNLNLMVFLNAAPGADTINIVYYDVSVKPRDQVNFSEVKVQPTQKIVQVNGVSISKDVGFVAGHKYEIQATRKVGNKETILAKGNVTLK